MSVVIGKLATILTANTGGFVRGIDTAKRSTKGFSDQNDKTGSSLGKMIKLLGIGAAVTALVAYTKASYDAIDATAKLSDELGISTETLQGYKFAAKITGTQEEVLTKGLQRMIRRLGEAKLGYGEGVKGLEAMGLSAEQLAAKSPADAMGDIAQGIADIKDPAERAAAAYALFGRQGQELMNFLMLGREGINQLVAENEQLGASFSRMDAAKVEAANDAMTRLKTALTGAAQAAAFTFAPLITNVVNLITRGFVWMRNTVGGLIGGMVKTGINWFNSFVEWVAPLIVSFGGVVTSVFHAIGEVAGTVWGYVTSTFGWVSDKIGGFGNVFTWLRDIIVRAFLTMQFAITNWRNVLAYVFIFGAYQAVRFANSIKHWFTVALPAYLNWFGENWKAVFRDMWNWTVTVFSNIAINIYNIFKNLPGLITGSVSFGDLWTPLTKGFEATVKELPKIAEREIGGLEKTLGDSAASLGNEISKSYGDFMTDKMKELKDSSKSLADSLKGMGKGPEAAKMNFNTSFEGADTAFNKAASKSAGAFARGSVQAYSAALKSQNMTIEKANRETAKNTKAQVEQQKETNRLLVEANKMKPVILSI